MNIISKKSIKEFSLIHPDAEQSLKLWYSRAKKAKWKTPNDIKEVYPSASIIENNRVVFNIKGNHYRLVVAIKYDFETIYIRFIGTHAEYDEIDVSTI